MTEKKSIIPRSPFRKWLRRILITLLTIILIPIGLFTIGWLNRDTIIDSLQVWYRENNNGTLTIGSVNASFFSGFPKVGFTLKDINEVHNDTISDQFSTVIIEEAQLVIGARNLLTGNIKFEKITVKNAVIATEVVSKRSLEYHEQLKRKKLLKEKKGIQIPEWLNKNGASLVLNNVKFVSKDSILDKCFNLQIHKLRGSFKRNDQKLTGSSFLDVTVNNLGFNTKKGSFFNGAHVTGRPIFSVNLDQNTIQVSEFPLHIDSQTFNLIANFDLSESNAYSFTLENSLTDFLTIKKLLPDSLKVKLKNYQIEKPFNSSLKLEGQFAYGNNPDIEAHFSTHNNNIIIADKFHFNNTSFSGHLTNDIYSTDSLKQTKKSKKDIKIVFDAIKADLEDIKVEIDNAFFQSTPETLNFIQANLRLEGSNETLASVIETDNFDFDGGRFQLNATISGDIPNPYQFLNKTTGTFKLNDTEVILKKNGLQLPVQTIDLSLERENSYLRELTVNLPNGEQLIFKGQLKNISGIISKNPKLYTTSKIFLDAEDLNINEVIAMAKRFIPKNEVNKNNRKTLHETLNAIYSQFHPQFGINVNNLQYNNVVINELKSTIDLKNSETVVLKNFEFLYEDAVTNLNGNVIVHGPNSKLKDAVYMDAEATSSGSIMVFKKLFDIKLFRFDAGEYLFHGKVEGDVKAFNELLNNAKGDLTLTNTKLYYDPADMEIEIDSLALLVDKSDIFLNKFKLEIDDLYPITLNGTIRQFPSFLLKNKLRSGSIYLNISAEYFDGDNLLSTINTIKKDENNVKLKKKKALHRVFKDINKFNPKIELSIDSIKFKDYISENVNALVYFENDSILKLHHLNLDYKNSTAKFQGIINAHTSVRDSIHKNPFDLDFITKIEGKSEDLNDLLRTTNFIFKSGEFQFEGTYTAQSQDLDILNSKTVGDLKISNALVNYKAASLEVPIDSLHIAIEDDLATLKTLDIDLPGKSSIDFSGSIDNFSDFIYGSSEQILHSSDFTVFSPYLDTSDIKTFLKNSKSKTENDENTELDLSKPKNALKTINSSFNPSLSITIDTLKHKAVDLTDFGADLFFDTSGNLKLEDTKFNFYGGYLSMNAEVGMEENKQLPVMINLNAEAIDIHELVTRFDYFNNEDLRNTDKIAGNVNFSMDAIATLGTDGNLLMNTLNGIFQIELNDLALYNYKPIMDNSIMMKDERFENLEFRPIVQTFEIRDGVLIIPRTEIQSTAIHLFVEGKIKFNDYVDIWLSLPWSNLKSNDGLTLPEKKSYKEAGHKFYIELVQDKNSEKKKKQDLNVKFRLSNRKLRKEKKGQ